ncbi:MAG: hypothetical protein V4466_05160 [Pseudomonadota bacterium]
MTTSTTTYRGPAIPTVLFDKIAAGEVSFLLFSDQYGVQRGDRIVIGENIDIPDADAPDGRKIEARIDLVLVGEPWGLRSGFVALQLALD